MKPLTKYFFLVCALFFVAAFIYPKPELEEVQECFNRISERAECIREYEAVENCYADESDCKNLDRIFSECMQNREDIKSCYGNGVSNYLILFSALFGTTGIVTFFDEWLEKKNKKKKK